MLRVLLSWKVTTVYTICSTTLHTEDTILLYLHARIRLRVVLIKLSNSVQVMTVPFNMASGASVTLRVEVRDGMTEVSVAVKIPRCITLPTGSFTAYLIVGLNATLLHSRAKRPVTVHVRVTSSLGQTAP